MLSPTIFSDLIQQTPTKIVGAAGTVTVLVQLVKRFVPKLSGWKALAFNLVCSWGATLAMGTPSTGLVLAIAAAASGVHGTAKSLAPVKTEVPKYAVSPSFTAWR